MRLLDREDATPIAEVAMRLDVALPGQKGPARLAMAPGRLGRAAFGDPVVPLIAVEEIVAAIDKRRRYAVFEFKKCGAMAGRCARPIESARARTHARHEAAAEQSDDLDLMYHLVEGDAAAGRIVELVRAVWPQQEIIVVEAQNHPEPAERAAFDQRAHAADIRVEGMGVPDDDREARPLCRRDDAVAILKRQGKRLLDQDMLAVLQGLDGLPGMMLMRRSDVDCLDRRIAAQVFESRVRPRAEIAGKGFTWALERIHGGAQDDMRMRGRGADHERAGKAEAGDCETDRGRRPVGAGGRKCGLARAHQRIVLSAPSSNVD